ncbi:MAG: DUF2064 domain-containing protein [Pseudomonadota bacterium]
MTERTVLIFAKPPLIGLSKTRLAGGLGRAEARRIARMTTAKTLRAAVDPRWRTVLYAAPDKHRLKSFGGLWPQRLARASQGRGDLSDRLDRGLREAPRGDVLFIGADAPDVTKARLWQAFQDLKRADAVFGPATDGGFWLFGVRRSVRFASPFRPARWSGPHALSDVLGNLPPKARTLAQDTLIDLDEAEDWRAWRTTKNQ